MSPSRSLALACLRRWRTGTEFADKIVGDLFGPSGLGPADRAFALELFYGVLRNLTLLDFWIGQLRSTHLDALSRDIVRLGFYQVLLIETADHAAVFETVQLASARGRGLINALLRRALREKSALRASAAAQPLAVRFSEPEFLVAKWRQQFGETAVADLCRWNNQPAPVFARINPLRLTPAEFLEKYPGSALLAGQANFATLPEPGVALAKGDCYLQDPSTLLAGDLLAAAPGENVLDACAAPGGKSAYLAALMANQGTLVATDREAGRLERLRENLVRLGVGNAAVTLCDWTRPGPFPERSFDKILVDVPCSNTGVMRRRVDVRWRLRPADFQRMPAQQLALLQNVAPLLKLGGALVYSTCSLEPEENEAVLERFLRAQSAFRLTTARKSLPFRDGFDGAYAARLELTG